MNIAAWLVIGVVAGLTARKLIPGKSSGGSVLTVLIGIAGALGAGFLGILAGAADGIYGFSPSTLVLALAGSLLLLLLYRSFAGSELRT